MHVSSSPDLALSVDTDQATSDVRVTGNLAHHTEGGTMYQHYGHNVTIDNNIFALATVRLPVRLHPKSLQGALSAHPERSAVMSHE